MAKRKKNRLNKEVPEPSRIILPPEQKIIIPGENILRPASPYIRRASNRFYPVPDENTIEGIALKKEMATNLEFQLKWKEVERKYMLLVQARIHDGSGLQMGTQLRSFFLEYISRYSKYGQKGFPTSFNVIEAFMAFKTEILPFDLLQESEHLLSLDDYFRWYESGDIPKSPMLVSELFREKIIYSYEFVAGGTNMTIAGDTEMVIAGVSFVRHENELSCMLLAGENPPELSDKDINKILFSPWPSPGKDGIAPDPSLSVKDRYLDGFPNFARIILLTRLDLKNGKHDVRYVNLDLGATFRVITDDLSIYENVSREKLDSMKRASVDGLERYNDLISVLVSMIYLPAFLIVNQDSAQLLRVSTELAARQKDKEFKELFKEIGKSNCNLERTICCVPSSPQDAAKDRKIQPPDIQFKREGYWKILSPQELGEGKNGEIMFGRTWVSKHETWSARGPSSFILRKSPPAPNGPDPGWVYVQRCSGHGPDIYKVGLTRRKVEIRACELSSASGVPIPFDVIAKWLVGDCSVIEKMIHKLLDAYRINENREFFRADLALICKTIDQVVRNDQKDSQ